MTQQVQNRGVEVVDVHRDFPRRGNRCRPSGRTNAAPFDAAAGHPDGVGILVVVASDVGPGLRCSILALDHRCAAEFGAPDDERLIEQATRLEVFDQRGDRLVNLTDTSLAGW